MAAYFRRNSPGAMFSALFLFASILPGTAPAASISGALPDSRPISVPVLSPVHAVYRSAVASVAAAPPAAVVPAAPEIGARAAIVVEHPSGRIVYQKDARTRMAMASTTKIMTAILALEYGKLDEQVLVSSTDLVRGTSMGLRAGETLPLRNLLYGMLLNSGNDAANTVARYVGGQDSGNTGKAARASFIAMMNARAQQLGLKDSHFVNPHGLDNPNHYTTAYDLASMTWYAMRFDTFNQIVRQPTYTASGHPLKNLNKMLERYIGAEGVKTGYTGKAGLCLVTSATRNGKRLITVVLNDPKLYDDSSVLLDYGFAVLATNPKGKAEKLGITTASASR
jgi:serine-type D-Ala-D-Ala carboxypeptidase (penicillin-binding protein 5/6)